MRPSWRPAPSPLEKMTRSWMTTLLLLLAVASGCGGASKETGTAPPVARSAQSPPAASSSKHAFIASIHAPTHRPKMRQPWKWVVMVTSRDGRPLAARAKVQFLFGGRVVGRGARSHFVGVHHGTIRWPKRSIGFPLTFRVVVRTPKGTAKLDYPVQVRR